MYWTKETPTVAGPYWMKGLIYPDQIRDLNFNPPNGTEPEIVNVWFSNDNFHFDEPYYKKIVTITRQDPFQEMVEWAGPIMPPYSLPPKVINALLGVLPTEQCPLCKGLTNEFNCSLCYSTGECLSAIAEAFKEVPENKKDSFIQAVKNFTFRKK